MKYKRMLFKAVLPPLLLLCLIQMTGCTHMIVERDPESAFDILIEAGTDAPVEDEYADTVQTATLYFISEDGSRLVPVTQELALTDGISRVEAALDALEDGVPQGETSVGWPLDSVGRATRRIEVSGKVATVNLAARYRMLDQQTLYAVRQAVANTLTEFAEVSSVNVLVGGREEGLDIGASMPVGTLTHVNELDVASRYARLDEQRSSGAGYSRLVTLYLPTRDGRLVLPVVRSIAFEQVSSVDALYTLLSELGKGADSALVMKGFPAPLDYLYEMPEIVRTQDGAYRAIEIRFSDALWQALADTNLTLYTYLQMLTDTLMGFVPGVEGLQIHIGTQQITFLPEDTTPDGREIEFVLAMCTREDFVNTMGAPRTLYARVGDSKGLTQVVRVLRQDRQSDPRALMNALIDLSGEEDVFALPEGLTNEDILAVRVEEDDVVVNLSAAFGDALLALDEEDARTAIYAIVNTLTQDRSQQGVIFFFEGEQMVELAGGLNLLGRMLRNPGMVVNEHGSMGVF